MFQQTKVFCVIEKSGWSCVWVLTDTEQKRIWLRFIDVNYTVSCQTYIQSGMLRNWDYPDEISCHIMWHCDSHALYAKIKIQF